MRSLAAAPAVVLLLALTVCPAQAGFIDDLINQVKSIFQTYEEAPYVVAGTGNGYQERVYSRTKWVCKTVSDNPRVGEDLSLLFWPLFNYINGQNNRNEKIPMTVPVSTEVTIRSQTDKTYKMCFYLAEQQQQNPPEPLPSSGVFIQDRQELRVLTRTVGGYMTSEENWMQEAGELAAVLQENGITVNLAKMYWVGYDSPMKFWGRRNEIWFPVGN
ncbi:heme-binding protein 2-like [Portunus trituberculatus]|uniref:heme-binding protein 2-like n=1 Tax=Portunus trituberculatus TaxID=210409 RepID=UPI001E1D1EC6|nr:heme-binding protein 2-like [Portunus trituberculatus]